MEKIICLGDSLTLGYPFERKDSWPSIIEKETGLKLLNFGVNGESSQEILFRAKKEQYFSIECSKATILCGSNDFVFNINQVSTVVSNTLKMAELCKQNNIEPLILIPPLCNPSQAESSWMDGDYCKVNEELTQLREILILSCQKVDFSFIDLQEAYKSYRQYEDGLHPTKEGYIFIAKIIKDKLIDER